MARCNQLALTTLLSALMAAGVMGCAGKHVTLTARNVEPPAQAGISHLMSGLAKVDITPGPGMPTGGYSMLGKRAEGFRTRLYARAVFIQPKEGRPVCLVQCDLLSGSLLLHHKVAEAVAEQTGLDPAGLMIAGTHTHSAPGNYFSTVFYNNFASCKKGFEAEFFDFLSQRVAKAVIQAYENRRPARIATGTATVTEATRNRSLPAYLRNKNVQGQPTEQEAVNPLLHMIRIDCLGDDGAYHPAGAYSNFSIHPTAIGEKNRLYNGDVFAYIEREVEWGIKRLYDTPFEPIHAAANYTHGDGTPDIPPAIDEGFIEAKRIGKIVGKAALDLFQSLDGSLLDDPPVQCAAKEFDVLEEPSMGDAHLCGRGVVGCALTAGATTRYTPVLRKVPFFAPGWPRWVFTKGCQAEKRVVGGPFQYLVLPKDEFPHLLFLQMIRVSDTLLMPVPFEVCMEEGARMTKAVQTSAQDAGMEGVSRYVLQSCSNGYWGYVTTPEEYSLQYYEGGHTLYGPQTGAFLGAHLAAMAGAMARHEEPPALPSSWTFDLKEKSYLVNGEPTQGKRKSIAQPVFHEAGKNLEAFWSFEWLDAEPGSMAFDKPLAAVETRDGQEWRPLVLNGEPMDDTGYDISVTHLGRDSKSGMSKYRACWHDPEKASGKAFRFAILPRIGREILYSEPFN